MKRIAFLIALACGAYSVSADPKSFTVNPIPIIKVADIAKADLGIVDGPGGKILGGFVSGEGIFYFRLSRMDLARLRSDFTVEKRANVLSDDAYAPGGSILFYSGNVIGVVTQYDEIKLYYLSGTYSEKEYAINSSLSFIVAIGDVLIFRTDTRELNYVIYSFAHDGTMIRREKEEATKYLSESVPGVTVKDGVISYKGNELTRNLSFNQVDDDGNFYETRSVFKGDKEIALINSTTDDYDNYLQSFIDNEGNFWAMDFTKDEKQSLVLLYAGRDWGYREPPKKAVTTEAGLRIRLRASTDAFVLGSLGKGEAITILKTGETATIGGITAPWYRIKKADGLIGWAFGGYIKVVE